PLCRSEILAEPEKCAVDEHANRETVDENAGAWTPLVLDSTRLVDGQSTPGRAVRVGVDVSFGRDERLAPLRRHTWPTRKKYSFATLRDGTGGHPTVRSRMCC